MIGLLREERHTKIGHNLAMVSRIIILGAGMAGPHAVTEVRNGATSLASYTYDANGNMTGGDERAITWTSFNKPSQISAATSQSTFLYGPDRARIQQVKTAGTSTTTIKYVGTRFEQVTPPASWR